MGSDVSQPSTVIDGSFYDGAVTGNDNTKWYHLPSALVRDVTSNGASVSSTTGLTLHPSTATYNTTWANLIKYDLSIAIEFDVVEVNNIVFLIYYNSTNTIADNNFRLSTGHYKIEIKTDGIYINGVKKIDTTISGTVTVGFQNPNQQQTCSLTYKNFVIYPI